MKKKHSDQIISVYVTEQEKEEIQELAKKQHSSVSSFVKRKIFDSEFESSEVENDKKN